MDVTWNEKMSNQYKRSTLTVGCLVIYIGRMNEETIAKETDMLKEKERSRKACLSGDYSPQKGRSEQLKE